MRPALKSSDKKFLLRLENSINRTIRGFFPRDNDLIKASLYSVSGNAKRIRPLLVKRILDAFGRPWINSIQAAVTVEIIHNFSLVHDDLPCMDNSTLRRGKLACHKKFSESTAVLVGDLLLSGSFLPVCSYSASVTNDILKFSIRSINNLIYGQYVDINHPPTDKRGLVELFDKKTGSLFELSSLVAMTLMNRINNARKFSSFGRNLGILFQATDDYLDSTGNRKVLMRIMESYYNKTVSCLGGLGCTNTEPLEEYIDIIYGRVAA